MSTSHRELHVADEAAFATLAQLFVPVAIKGGVVYLQGNLGAGKTTFARALLQALGVQARIKSPTYSLIESYKVENLTVHHLDLYRIADPSELEWLGLADLTEDHPLLLIEWPERAQARLPAADLVIVMAHAPHGRDLQLAANSPLGHAWLQVLNSEDSSDPQHR